MKCILQNKTYAQLAPGEKQKLMDALNVYNDEYLKRESEQLRIIITNNLLKIIVIACNDAAKIGGQRMTKIITRAAELLYHSNQDDIFFVHADQRVKQILGEKQFDNFFKNETVELDIPG